MAKEKKKRKRLFFKVEGKSVYNPTSEYVPFNFNDSGDTGELGDDGLTHKQRLFVQAYVGPASGNASQAARLAGYGKGNIKKNENAALGGRGHNCLRLPMVQEAIARELAKRKMSAEWTKLTLFEIANANLANFYDVDETTGEKLKLNFKKAVALGAMRQLKEYDPEKGTIKLVDPVPAQLALAKFYNLVNETKEETELPLETHPLNRMVQPPAGLN